MSIACSIVFNEDQPCPVCGKNSCELELNSHTSEMEMFCTRCRFEHIAEIQVDKTGTTRWVETTYYPMDGDKVLRPKKRRQVRQDDSGISNKPNKDRI